MSWPQPGGSRRWASGPCPVCGTYCRGVHAERVLDLQPGGVPMGGGLFTIPADVCDDEGRLFRAERLVARTGDRVPISVAQEWGLLPEAAPIATAGPGQPPSPRRRASRDRTKPRSGDR